MFSLLENIRVRRAGYAFRLSYNEALERYKMLSTRTWPKWKRSPKDGIKAIMVVCVLSSYVNVYSLYAYFINRLVVKILKNFPWAEPKFLFERQPLCLISRREERRGW